MAVGDLLGSGTISGPEMSEMSDGPGNKGSLLEMTGNGKRALRIGGGRRGGGGGGGGDGLEAVDTNDKNDSREQAEQRMFLEDGDTVTIRGWCGGSGAGGGGEGGGSGSGDGAETDALVGFGECVGTIKPAVELGL